MCSICLDHDREEEKSIRLSCGHTFHDYCVMEWLLTSPTCPLCRRDTVKYILMKTLNATNVLASQYKLRIPHPRIKVSTSDREWQVLCRSREMAVPGGNVLRLPLDQQRSDYFYLPIYKTRKNTYLDAYTRGLLMWGRAHLDDNVPLTPVAVSTHVHLGHVKLYSVSNSYNKGFYITLGHFELLHEWVYDVYSSLRNNSLQYFMAVNTLWADLFLSTLIRLRVSKYDYQALAVVCMYFAARMHEGDSAPAMATFTECNLGSRSNHARMCLGVIASIETHFIKI